MQLDAAHCWLERSNPLSGLSIRSAQSIFDAAREGDTQRLHWLYQEIEAANPILFTCIERRQSALAAFQPKIAALPSAEGGLAEEQKDAAETFLAGIENFTDLLEHLDSAFFRGFALAQPIWEADGTVREVVLHNSWEFLVHDGTTWHNPECTGWDPRRCVSCADAGLIGIQRRRAIDYPALAVHIRHAVSERDWGRFLERYALPKPAVTMAPNATTENRADYLLAAKAVENGQVSVWPNGTGITDFAGGSRGTDPFNSFIDHQEKLIMLLATGGTLTSLAQADTGSLAGGAQFKVWREIVARDSVVAAQAVMRSLLKPYLQRAFGARPCAISLAFEVPAERNAKEAAELAATLRNAGWSIDQAELEKATGFTLEKAPTAPQTPPFAAAKAQTALHFDENPLQNAGKRKDGQSPVQDETAPKSKISGVSRLEEAIADAMAGVMAGVMAEEVAAGGADAKGAEEPDEITQETAEKLYEQKGNRP